MNCCSQVDALRPLKAKAASLGALEREVGCKDELIASLQRQVSAAGAARSSPGRANVGTTDSHAAAAQRTSMEVITLQAEVGNRVNAPYNYCFSNLVICGDAVERAQLPRRSLQPEAVPAADKDRRILSFTPWLWAFRIEHRTGRYFRGLSCTKSTAKVAALQGEAREAAHLRRALADREGEAAGLRAHLEEALREEVKDSDPAQLRAAQQRAAAAEADLAAKQVRDCYPPAARPGAAPELQALQQDCLLCDVVSSHVDPGTRTQAERRYF